MIHLPKKTKRYLTLVFTDTTLTLIKLDNKGNKIEQFKEFALPQGYIVNGEIQDKKKVAIYLIKLRQRLRIKKADIALGLSDHKATVYSMALPNIEADEVVQVVEREAGSHLPFPYDEEYVDWMSIVKENEKETDKKTIIVSAVPKSVIDPYVEACAKASFTPVSIETGATALYRLLPKETQGTCMLVKANTLSTVVFVRKDRSVISNTVVHEQSDLIATITKLINYYVQKVENNKSKRPKTIYLCGPGAGKALKDSITSSLNIPAQFLTAKVANLAKEKQAAYATIVSFARSSVSRVRTEETINLTPPALIRRYKDSVNRKTHSVITFVASSILILSIVLSAYLLFILNQEEARTALSNNSQMSQQAANEYSKAKIALLDSIAQKNSSITEGISQILESQPPGIQVTGIQYSAEDTTLLIGGRANTRETLLNYKDVLESTNAFSKVTIPLSSLEQEMHVMFRIIAIVE